jgi:oligopeptide/dipeptide ABC transporter ATP-binding protein
MTGEVLLSVEHLKKYFPVRGGIFLRQVATVYAVDDVSFEVRKGETLGIVGESGCGKSTLARTILRLEEPTGGSIAFGGRDITRASQRELRLLRREMQMIFQDPSESLNARHTVGGLLEEPFIIHRLGTPAERKRWVGERLEKVGLNADAAERFPHEFSGGQRQRIGIARAIALKPGLIVCDEPVSALDVSIQSQILNLLLSLQREMHLTLVFIAHDLSVVKHVSDRIAVMYLGKIVETASAESLYRNPLHPYSQSLIAAIPEPDPSQRKTLYTIEGDVPSPLNPPRGCRFHTRCRFAQARCREEEPALTTHKASADPEHRVACHFAGEVFIEEILNNESSQRNEKPKRFDAETQRR